MNNREEKKVLFFVLLFLAGCFALGLTGGTMAYYHQEKRLGNPFTTGSSQVALNEEFDPTSSFLPGEKVVKEAYFKNTGKTDLYLRIKDPLSTATWIPEKDDAGRELDIKAVEINWSQSWKEDWQQLGDYYYYEKVLPAGEKTELIIESLSLNPEVSNDRHGPDYSEKTFSLNLKAEAVSSGSDGTEWGVRPIKQDDGTVQWQDRQ